MGLLSRPGGPCHSPRDEPGQRRTGLGRMFSPREEALPDSEASSREPHMGSESEGEQEQERQLPAKEPSLPAERGAVQSQAWWLPPSRK